MSKLILGVGLFGPLVVAGAMMTLEIVHAVLGNRGSHEDLDELAGMPCGWMLALFCGGALAIADVIVASVGYGAPLAMLARTALGGALAGLIVGRVLAIGNGAALMIVGVLWPVAIVVGYAVHIGALWLVLRAI